MELFNGIKEVKIDSKGRVFFPARFRKILQTEGESRLLIREDIHKECLVLSPVKNWEEEMKNLDSRLNPYNEEAREIMRDILMGVKELELDSSGRISIPKDFLLFAKITNTICFHGMLKTIEVWNPDLLRKSKLSREEKRKRIQQFLGSNPINENIINK